ncbi:hypothetical protein [Geodermatophilus ruber]|uniref:Alpha/beta hydrolase family protein n=1 Tax=Geodermatophilus ruber TaxID=504800 RepID=A0A1I4CFR5_9ACTN|nr:hypothetical protein [Geodermatophilus ruber]SFK79119.1 hypothetical protein SAMN04488085_103452 [Geodermatophilus ruber]
MNPDVQQPARPDPTVVLLHGAFADASSWNEVIALLQQRGRTAVAPPPDDGEVLGAVESGVPAPTTPAR